MASTLASSARDVVTTATSATNRKAEDPTSGAFFSNLTNNFTESVSQVNQNINLQPLQSFTKSLSHNLTGRNTLPDKTTASQVLMFRQLLHTKCRPGLRLSRAYQGTPAQRAVLHMPWWERGIETTKKMVISYDNLITRLWLSGAIMPFERGGYAAVDTCALVEGRGRDDGDQKATTSSIDTLINEKGLPPIPHDYWVDRMGFQQTDPVTDFRSGGVLSLAMLVHIVESCPSVHSRFVPKPNAAATDTNKSDGVISLEEIISDDASVLPFGITCINITDMLAKFLMFSKAVDKMDALLSAKPFWKMFIDPNALLVLQEVSLDLLCDVCVELGRERRVKHFMKLAGKEVKEDREELGGMPGATDGKVTVFDFAEILQRTEKRVGDELLDAGPQNVDELRAIGRRVKSKYLMRIQLQEKHNIPKSDLSDPVSPLGKQLPKISKESVKNVGASVIGGVGGFVSMLKSSKGKADDALAPGPAPADGILERKAETSDEAPEVEIGIDGSTSEMPKPPANPLGDLEPPAADDEVASETGPVETDAGDELDKLSAELAAEAFDLLGGDFDNIDVEHSEELLDMMDDKVDPMTAFAFDDF